MFSHVLHPSCIRPASSARATAELGLEVALFTRAIDPAYELSRYMVDAYIMADAVGFVGSFESTAPRVIHALATGVYGCLKPFISLTHNWYWTNWFAGAEKFNLWFKNLPKVREETALVNLYGRRSVIRVARNYRMS